MSKRKVKSKTIRKILEGNLSLQRWEEIKKILSLKKNKKVNRFQLLKMRLIKILIIKLFIMATQQVFHANHHCHHLLLQFNNHNNLHQFITNQCLRKLSSISLNNLNRSLQNHLSNLRNNIEMISKRDSIKNVNNLIRPQETTSHNQEDQLVNNLMVQKLHTTPSTLAKSRDTITIEMGLK